MKRNLLANGFAVVMLAGGFLACSSLPEPKMEKSSFPEKNVYVEKVTREHKVLGVVKSRVDYTSLDPQHDEKQLCYNYYNKAARQLLKYAKDKGADAVIDVRSVVFLEDGRAEAYKTPECSDDGAEGQILLQGLAVKWAPLKPGETAPSDKSVGPPIQTKVKTAPAQPGMPEPQMEWE